MIEIATLKKLETIVGFEETVKAIGMQALLHTTKIKPRHIKNEGLFSNELCSKFENLLGEDKASAVRALAYVNACCTYDQRVSFQGLGGCEIVGLEQLIDSELKELKKNK